MINEEKIRSQHSDLDVDVLIFMHSQLIDSTIPFSSLVVPIHVQMHACAINMAN